MSALPRYLCVGGPLHGQFIAAPFDRRWFRVPVAHTPTASWWLADKPEDRPTIQTVEYELFDHLADQPIWLARS